MVAYTCRYSSGPLIPKPATATLWSTGINCPQKYLQVSAITLVSLLFIYMIPIDCKITIFFLYFFGYLFKNIMMMFGDSRIPLQKKQWLACASRIKYWNSHKASTLHTQLCSACPLHSNISKEQHEKRVCNLSSHYGKYGKFTHEMHTPYLDM